MFNTFHKLVLGNGLRLITIPMDSVPSITVLISIGAGSRYESREINGISHFLEHMAFKGTKKRPSALDISEIIDGIGGEFNAFTSKDHTGYYIKAHIKHTNLLFDVLSDMLLNSLFHEAEMNKERDVISEEINMYEDTPAKKVGDLFEHLLYGNHPLGWEISGQLDNIQSITRQDMISYLDRLYGPANCVVTVAGGLGLTAGNGTYTSDDITSLTQKWLGDWKKTTNSHFLKVSDKQEAPRVLVRYKKTEQAHLCLGMRSFPLGHPRRYALAILSAILGGGMSSRLFIEVREKRGLAYYVRSGAEQYHDTGNFVTQAGVDMDRITDAISVILEQFKLMTTADISTKEFQRAKEYIKGRLTLELEDSRAVAGLYGSQELLEGKIRTPQEIMKAIDQVVLEEVVTVAKELFVTKKLNLAVIGPFEEKERFEKALRG